jgi:K+/H+ antiporter YhaU regulatory subunit KhtT
VLDHLPLGNGLSVVYWTADERVLGRTLATSELRSRWHLVLLAVRSAGLDELNIMPPPEYAFRPGDVLVLAGADARLQSFTR